MKVLSLRKIIDKAFYEVVFEWEDTLAECFHTQINKVSKAAKYSSKAYCLFNKGFKLHQRLDKNPACYFVMRPNNLDNWAFENSIPIFMDVWNDSDLYHILAKTRNLKLFYCTSMEVYRRLIKMDGRSHVRYMPLSVSDKYWTRNFVGYEKSIDVVQVGRRNPVLHEYMMRYTEEHPNVEYIYTNGVKHNELIEYESTRKGTIGIVQGRREFIKMLSSARVSLVSTPAIDGSREGAVWNDFLTPRFYESAVLGCAMIGRYRENEETEKIKDICPNISTYEQFCLAIRNALAMSTAELYAQNEWFIIQNLTSCRAQQIKEDCELLLENGCSFG